MIAYAIGLLGLLIASIQDIKSREIENYIWIGMAVIGLLLSTYLSFTTGNFMPIISSISGFIICFIIGYLMFVLGIGGADGKILMGMGALIPSYAFPVYSSLQPLYTMEYIPWFPLLVFFNGVILMIVLPIYLFFKNLSNGVKPKKLKEYVLMLVGEYITVAEAKKGNKVVLGKGKDVKLIPSVNDDKNYDLSKYKDTQYVWATPELPLLVPIALSYIITPFLGDKILSIILPM
ncbi:preflagellin peptidase FlaK [Methanococcus voltae]|uniref:Preflagellin peptidase n=3 Tax=Methanococcus voltae TaxID=2188 RepID=FLAK_METVO|nr:preflagellin peptidase FlaK [Methanococcus voltae]Q8NKW5.1 RecName: Full=Preflagellin peptidase; Short=PFP [Methanococcus voltae]AAM34242.1 FlaK [Methanococcus voltae PS]MBP2172587.1 preflagellin peptidase FlaK [Methanococcus voltae]MBP2201506.1 preflagellin peptidase FlaK [Methanococcus voltae]MCS3922295.1 preflagellin peptidase FlaK [Methanococcus voltae PS]